MTNVKRQIFLQELGVILFHNCTKSRCSHTKCSFLKLPMQPKQQFIVVYLNARFQGVQLHNAQISDRHSCSIIKWCLHCGSFCVLSHWLCLLATKTHGSVSCDPRSPGCAQTGVSTLTGKTKLRFSRIHRSVTFYPKITKFAVELPAYKGRLDSKIEVNRARCFRDTRDLSVSFCSLFFFSSSFRTNHKIGSNSQVHTPIRLKFGTLVDVSINFGQNPYKLLKVIYNRSFAQNKNNLQTHLQGKLLTGST